MLDLPHLQQERIVCSITAAIKITCLPILCSQSQRSKAASRDDRREALIGAETVRPHTGP